MNLKHVELVAYNRDLCADEYLVTVSVIGSLAEVLDTLTSIKYDIEQGKKRKVEEEVKK